MKTTPYAVPLAEPPPPPGLDAWTAPDPPGAARLPWLPDAGRDRSAEDILLAIFLVVVGLGLLLGGDGWERLAGAVLLPAGGAIAWHDARQRARARERSFVAILPEEGELHVAHAGMKLDATLTLAGLRGVDVVPQDDGARLLLRHATAPAVMASGVLSRTAAEAAAQALARRLGIMAAAADAPPAAIPAWAPAMPQAPPARPAEPIPIGADPAAAGRVVTHVGIALVALGIFFLVIPGVPAMVRWTLGPGLLLGGAAVMRMRAGREATERARVAVVDRPAGSIALHGLWGSDVVHIPLAAVRRVMVVSVGDTTTVVLDCLDRPRVQLPMNGTHDQAEALAGRLAEAIGCPAGHG